ncbi:sigma-70 family RNA polymerase sigma factor [Intestinibacillus massiliensis]|nr:sigma-70 family RNA polymerase sigma factor [Intestinibacillus massiliensis]
MATNEEKILVSRAKRGEIAAFEELVTAYERRVFALALRSCGNEHDARDIVQEVFLRVYRSLESFRGDSGFSTWIYRITMNICVDFARRGAAAPQLTALEEEDGSPRPLPDMAPAHQPEAAAEASALRDEIQAALGELSEEHRTIVLLRDVSGLTYDEIARTLQLTEGTVKSRLARARRALREILLRRGNIVAPSTSKQAEGRTVQ